MSKLEPLSLDLEQCRQRQQWVIARLQELKADRVVFSRPEHVQYLSGFRPHRLMTARFSLDADGGSLLVAPNQTPDHCLADDVVCFEAQWHCTLRQDQTTAAEKAFNDAIDSCSHPITETDFEPHLWQRRRNKDADELAMIKRAIACTEAMYAKAREIIQPGITEIDVFNQLHAAAVEIAGEPLTDLGNDYRANAHGGTPRPRAAKAGELFILDLGPAYRGYYADNCRAFSVDGNVTDEQHRAWELIVRCLSELEAAIKPGVRCRAVFEQAQSTLDEYRVGAFSHHLGHGIGLYPHETPHLNPHWDDVFEEGDVFTMEPGLYGEELRAGIRLEQDYRVTSNGLERLTTHPLDLVI